MFVSTNAFVTPSASFNFFYILLYAYQYLLYEGVGLRQLLDYYFVLKNAPKLLYSEPMAVVRKLGMECFVRRVMWIMQEVFGLDADHLLCELDEKEGYYILEQIMEGGNFGHYDELLNRQQHLSLVGIFSITSHAFHLMTHYVQDVIWLSIWVLWHFLWRRIIIVK